MRHALLLVSDSSALVALVNGAVVGPRPSAAHLEKNRIAVSGLRRAATRKATTSGSASPAVIGSRDSSSESVSGLSSPTGKQP